MYRKTFEITGYTYDADTHCVECTAKRFIDGDIDYGRVHFDLDSPNIFDSEGNPIHPIFLGSEYDHQPYCGDCFAEIECTVSYPHYCIECGRGIFNDNRFCSQGCQIDYQTWLVYLKSDG